MTDPEGPGARAPSQPSFALWRPDDPRVSLATAVDYLSQKPAFASLPFGVWSRVLVFQIDRGHAAFVVDPAAKRVRGFLGWALATRARAEDWIEGRAALASADCRAGEIVIVNAFAADTAAATRFLTGAARATFADRQAVYFKRFYPDGRIRPMRLKLRPPPTPEPPTDAREDGA